MGKMLDTATGELADKILRDYLAESDSGLRRVPLRALDASGLDGVSGASIDVQATAGDTET